MQEIKRKQSITEGLYLYLLQKREESAISSSSSNVSIYKQIDDAASSGPASPNATHVYAYAFILALIIPIGLIQLRTMLNDKIMDKSDITSRVEIPVLGEISHIPKTKNVGLSVIDRNLTGEQFRVVRTNLSFLLKDKNKQTILITSTNAGEGKSFVSLNFAAVLAMPGKRVALLEFDLRSPGISKKIGIDNSCGISNYLSGQAVDILDMYHVVENIPTLHIYTSGPIPSNPADLLLDEKCQAMFKMLKKQYDYIIVDTPPTGFVIDTFILGGYSDAVMYIVKQRHTLKKQLDYINEIYRTQKLTNMGLLINDIKNSKTNGYGYGKGYGYPYGETKRGLLSRVFHPAATISTTTLSFKKNTPVNGTHYNNNLVK